MSEAVITKPQVATTTTALHFDEPAFLQKVPYTLHATTLAGVYSVPAPAASFNLATASQSDLTRAGILLRLPAAGDPPAVQAAWNSFLAHKWDPAKRIIPQFSTRPGVTHIMRDRLKHADGSYTSNNWSGTGTNSGASGPWTSIVGTWNIPSVSKAPEAAVDGGWDSSSWIGLDGYNSTNDVLQAGVEQAVNGSGVASYYAWYEWYAPKQSNSPGYIYETRITNFPVSPGQQVTCTVQYVGHTAGSISFGNLTTGQHFSITLAPPPGASFSGGSCEWIMETPGYSDGKLASMPRFTPVTFTGALACGTLNGKSVLANPASGDTINLLRNGKVLTATTAGNQTCTITFAG
jgi:hypothetical protein